MNQKFQAAVHQKDEVTYAKLGGVIDEDNELVELTDRIPPGTVVIDLADIERINSCGVRDWVNWLTRIERNGARVVLVECSPSIVSQINLVNNFTGNGVVKSFYAPYFCPNCEREKVLLVEANELPPPPHRAPICRCDECDGVMDFDDMEDSYFAFLATAKRVPEAARITQVMAEMSGEAAEKSRIRSRVGSAPHAQPGVAGGGSLTGSSLPSVPSIPSLSKTNATPRPPPGFGVQAASALSLPGISSSGNRTFAGGGSNPGSNPGVARGSLKPGVFAGSYGQPRSSRLVYVLVAVLIAAIGVLAVLLFSGNNEKDIAPRKSPSSVPALTGGRLPV
jgi:anti-anti-sigma regulatory factor